MTRLWRNYSFVLICSCIRRKCILANKYTVYYRISKDGAAQTKHFEADSDDSAKEQVLRFIESKREGYPLVQADQLFMLIPLA
jgi:hypothetical protein